MDNKTCVGYLTNVRDMFVISSKQFEGEDLKCNQIQLKHHFIDALNYAIELINDTERPQAEWLYFEGVSTSGYLECSKCGETDFHKKYSNFWPNCGKYMKNRKGGTE